MTFDSLGLGNLHQLRLVQTGMQVEPTVYDGVMYIRHSNEKYSAHNAANGDLIWEYSRPLASEVTGYETRLTVHRGRGVYL